MNSIEQWNTAHDEWTKFVKSHPELGYHPGRWQLHNFLRSHRESLVRCDAIRKAKSRHWIAHAERFPRVAFGCATGVDA